MLSDESREEDQIHCKHGELLKTLFSGLPYPVFAFIGEACFEVVYRSYSPSVVAFPQYSPEESCRSEVCIRAEHVDNDAEYSDAEVDCVVLDGVMFLLFLFLRRLLEHS